MGGMIATADRDVAGQGHARLMEPHRADMRMEFLSVNPRRTVSMGAPRRMVEMAMDVRIRRCQVLTRSLSSFRREPIQPGFVHRSTRSISASPWACGRHGSLR